MRTGPRIGPVAASVIVARSRRAACPFTPVSNTFEYALLTLPCASGAWIASSK